MKSMKKITEIKVQENCLLRPLNLKDMTIDLECLSPLIEDRFPDEVLKEILDKQTGKTKTTKKLRDLDKESTRAVHFTEGGEVGFPSYGFKKGMVECVPFVSSGRGNGAITKKLVSGNVQIINGLPPNDLIPIKFKKQGILKHNIGNVTKHSPIFYDWSCKLVIQYDANNISSQDIATLLDQAGFKMGIGAWRPKGRDGGTGTFGRYRVKRGG